MGGGGAHSPTGEGVGGPNSDGWRKSLALCLVLDIAESNANVITKNVFLFLLFLGYALHFHSEKVQTELSLEKEGKSAKLLTNTHWLTVLLVIYCIECG